MHTIQSLKFLSKIERQSKGEFTLGAGTSLTMPLNTGAPGSSTFWIGLNHMLLSSLILSPLSSSKATPPDVLNASLPMAVCWTF